MKILNHPCTCILQVYFHSLYLQKDKSRARLERYEAAKERRVEKDRMETVDALVELFDETDETDIVYPHSTNTVALPRLT